MLEQTAASPSAPREQLTHSSVHRLQFGGPLYIEICSGAVRGGISSSAANEAPASNTAVRTGMAKVETRIPSPCAASPQSKRCFASRRWMPAPIPRWLTGKTLLLLFASKQKGCYDP